MYANVWGLRSCCIAAVDLPPSVACNSTMAPMMKLHDGTTSRYILLVEHTLKDDYIHGIKFSDLLRIVKVTELKISKY